MLYAEVVSISRSLLGTPQELTIDQFIDRNLYIKYEGTRMEQLAQLNADYESVGYRAIFVGRRMDVDRAYIEYVELIARSAIHK